MRQTTPPATLVRAAALGLFALLVGACGDDPPQRSETNYCERISARSADLASPALGTGADVTRVVESWRAIAAVAPLAVEPEWAAMVDNVETAATVDPADPASMQRVADTARASEQAANRVIAYTQQTCGILIGAVAPSASPPETPSPPTT
jgi:hypothetical protein